MSLVKIDWIACMKMVRRIFVFFFNSKPFGAFIPIEFVVNGKLHHNRRYTCTLLNVEFHETKNFYLAFRHCRILLTITMKSYTYR